MGLLGTIWSGFWWLVWKITKLIEKLVVTAFFLFVIAAVVLLVSALILRPGMFAPEKIDPTGLELRIHNLVNAQREQNGLSDLYLDTQLSEIARKHSIDMVVKNFFDHANPDGLDPTARASHAGYSCYKNYGSFYTAGIAENIDQAYTYSTVNYEYGVETSKDYLSNDQIANLVVASWMSSPGHRQNILTPTYDREGIGVAIATNGKVLVTQDFC